MFDRTQPIVCSRSRPRSHVRAYWPRAPLAACLDALKDVVLSDVIAANRGALAITAFMPDERPVEVLSAHTTGSGY